MNPGVLVTSNTRSSNSNGFNSSNNKNNASRNAFGTDAMKGSVIVLPTHGNTSSIQ
jgi:hypothetical protein